MKISVRTNKPRKVKKRVLPAPEASATALSRNDTPLRPDNTGTEKSSEEAK